jgi:hypothetical protein
LAVLDKDGNTLWASGRTNDTGVIVDEKNQPVAGEHWWKSDCSARIPANEQKWQPHYKTITRQDQAQIYQDLSKNKQGYLTTSFLMINDEVKDNRLQPHGFLPLAERLKIAQALGDTTPLNSRVDENIAKAVESKGVGDDPDYEHGGKDSLTYVISNLAGSPVTVRVTLYHQSTAPYFLQDRFCVAPDGPDTRRLYFLAGHLNLDGTEADGWKLRIVQNSVNCSAESGTFRCS